MKQKTKITGRVSRTLVVALALIAVCLFTYSVAFAQDASGTLSATGDNVVSSLKSLASGGTGKAIFGVCLLIGCVCVISPKTRAVGISALAVGILVGAYGGLLDGLWTLFNKSTN